jgi:ADP-heptose:LPS heptosyltransferase
MPAGCELRTFRDLAALVEEYMQLAAWFGTDTGLYHLAAAIGLPATVFFGPTQPHKIVMPGQRNARVFRLAALGDTHCEVKSCVRPLCLHANVALWSHASPMTRLDETPPDCPLRALPPQALTVSAELSPA